MKCRKNVKDLMPTEKAGYVQAVIDLKTTRPSIIAAAQLAGATSRYDDYVWIHLQVMRGAHGGPAFSPWHREFLKQFERDLQDVSGNPNMTIPYWDWTTAQTAADPGWPFTTDLLGGLGTGPDNRVMTGRFADAAGEWVLNVRTGAVAGAARDNTTYLRRLPSPPLRPDGTPQPLPTQANARLCLARTAYDANNPWLEDPSTITFAQVNASFRKFLEYVMHNGPHGWVGGNMMPVTSPNDPVFFLHHCNIDRLWAVWQQKNAPPTTNYLPPSGTTASHDIDDSMVQLTAGNFAWPVLARPMDVQDHRAMGFWYASDLPIITISTSSVNFGNVPENLTTFKPIQFNVRTCRPVKFRITGITAGTNFSIPAGQGIVTVNHSDTLDPVVGNVYIQFQAVGPLPLSVAQAGSATIQAFIEDTEGYYAAPPAVEYIVGSWSVTFTATPIARPRSAITFVLDRSGSMSESAGVAGTKYDLLKSSLQVIADIMNPNDAVGLVSFDDIYPPHTITTLAPITPMGPLPPPPPAAGTGRKAISDAISGPDLVPRGWTAIGLGMIQGASVLNAERTNPGTPYTQFAMVVMTDGNENIDPRVNQAPVSTAISPFSNNVYAIGLGREGNVSDSTLGAIARYMLITGDITTVEQRFRLTKYFVQILAGITRTAIILDPQGDLLIGSEHRIPFQITEADVSMDVIAVCPFAFLLDLKLETPDGSIIDSTALSPNVIYQLNREDTFYRINLPALPARPDGSHTGQWTAILSISKQKIDDLLRRSDNLMADLKSIQATATLPYSLVVQAYSNIMLEAQVQQASTNPGEELKLYAELTEYQVPIAGRANVIVEVTEPNGTVAYVPLTEYASGKFKGVHTTTLAGIYQCRFKATGYTLRGKAFQREETRTASIFKPIGTVGIDPGVIGEILDRERERFCKLLKCLLHDKAMAGLLDRLGVDPRALMECLAEYCRGSHRERLDTMSQVSEVTMKNTDKEAILREVVESLKDEIRREVSKSLLPLVGNVEQVGILAAPEPDKIVIKEVPPDRHIHMDFFPVFVLEGDRLQQIDMEQAIKRAEEEHQNHDDEHDQGHEGEHGSQHGRGGGKKKKG